MRRRTFLGLFGGAAAWPLAARAQQAAMPAIVYIGTGSPAEVEARMAAFRKSLADGGFVEGRNVRIDTLWAGGHYDRLPALAAEAVRGRYAVIVGGGAPASLAIKTATSTVPIVFITAGDPVATALRRA
jgi:putative tryptophan/tyrosine transport system substrate-binding protein